jgi:hypothetical protein
VSAAESERRNAGDTPAATRKDNSARRLQIPAVDSFAARSLSLRPARLCRGLLARSAAHRAFAEASAGKPEPLEAVVVNRIEGSAR